MKQIKTIKRDFHTGAHTIPSLNLGSLAELAAALRARAAAPALLFDEPLRYPSFALAVVVGDVVGIVAAISTNFTGVEPAPRAIVGFDLITFTQAAAAARRARPRAVLLADETLRDACLALPVVVGNIVRIVAAVPRDFTWIELASAAVIGFDLIALAESIASAVRIAAPAVERRDEAGLDARFGLTIILCERLSEKDGKK